MSNWTKEPWFCMDDGFSRKHPRPTIYAPGDELRYVAWFDDIPSIGAPTPNLENARRVVDCVNACAGVAEMGSVKELVEAARDTPSLCAGCDCDISNDPVACEGFADRGTCMPYTRWKRLQDALAKFKLEENNEQTR